MSLVHALLPLAVKGPDPADVKPGWLGFVVFLALAAATVLLWLSFRKQLKKINIPGDDGPQQSPAFPVRDPETPVQRRSEDGTSPQD